MDLCTSQLISCSQLYLRIAIVLGEEHGQKNKDIQIYPQKDTFVPNTVKIVDSLYMSLATTCSNYVLLSNHATSGKPPRTRWERAKKSRSSDTAPKCWIRQTFEAHPLNNETRNCWVSCFKTGVLIVNVILSCAHYLVVNMKMNETLTAWSNDWLEMYQGCSRCQKKGFPEFPHFQSLSALYLYLCFDGSWNCHCRCF